jgi:DNA mismatch repair protein MutH
MVRRKLSRILFVYYEWLPRAPLGDLVISDVVDWEPDPEMMRVFEADWAAVQAQVLMGKAEDISESDGVALVAATKGPGGPPDRPQPQSDVLASRRAWALRPTFLKSVIERHRATMPRVFEVATTLEQRALGLLARHVGKRISDVETTIGMAPSKAKHRAALVVEKVVAARGGPSRRDLADVGIDLRVVQVDESMCPYEALSFPAFRYQELIREDWDESELLSRLNRFLLVPVVGGKGLAAVGSCVVQRPWIWAPTDRELEGIAREWAMYRDEIESGRALSLTSASRTQFIHVRPKGRTALDTDPAPGVGPVVKKCFWFNRDFVAEILRRGPGHARLD